MKKCTVQTDDGLFHDFTICEKGVEITDFPLPFFVVTTASAKTYFNPDHVVSIECEREGA